MADEKKPQMDELEDILSKLNASIREKDEADPAEEAAEPSAPVDDSTQPAVLPPDVREILRRMTNESERETKRGEPQPVHRPMPEPTAPAAEPVPEPEPSAPAAEQKTQPNLPEKPPVPKKKEGKREKQGKKAVKPQPPVQKPQKDSVEPPPAHVKEKDPKSGKKADGAHSKKNRKPDKKQGKKPEKTSASVPAAESAPPTPPETAAAVEPESLRVRRAPTRPGQIGAAILGAFIVLFVLIGIAASARQIWQLSADAIHQTKLKEELAVVVFPLVIVDTPEFTSPTSLDSSVVISSSIWKFIIDKADKSNYRRNDMGVIEVPNVDIEREIRRLFGSEVEIAHQSVDDGIIQISYSLTSNHYYVETVPHTLPYTPRVDRIDRENDIYTLRVSYLLPDVLWNLDSAKTVQTADKVMEYRLQKVEGDYQVLSVKLLEVINQNLTSSPEDESDFGFTGEPGESEPDEPDESGTNGEGNDPSSEPVSSQS